MSNKVIKMPKRRVKSKIPFMKLREEAVNSKEKNEVPQGDSPETVQQRGYSLLQIAIQIVGDRAIDMWKDVFITLDGKPLMGVGRIELSKYPPHFGMTIVDEKQFQDSINKAGFFYAHGFTLSKLLIGRNYPALKCATCAEEGREGWLRLELGGYCDNPECPYAHYTIKALQITKTLNPQEDNPDNPPPAV